MVKLEEVSVIEGVDYPGVIAPLLAYVKISAR
jgi:hypothetical protein